MTSTSKLVSSTLVETGWLSPKLFTFNWIFNTTKHRFLSRVRQIFCYFLGSNRELYFVFAWIAWKDEDEDARNDTRTVPGSLSPSLGLFLCCFNWSLGSLMQRQEGQELVHCRCTHGKADQEKILICQISLLTLNALLCTFTLGCNWQYFEGETIFPIFLLFIIL